LATKTIDRLPDANGSRAKPKSTSNRTADPQVSLRYLKDEEYAAWDELVRVSPQGSVFSISWWVKAVNARVLGLFKSGRLVAGIPLYYEKRMGMKMCRLPKLTQTFGVVMEPFSGKRVTTTNREMEILTIFAEHLAKERVFSQCFHPSLVNWMPFLWNRFQQTSRFTYVLDDLSDLDAIWDGMEPKLRNVVRKARTLGIELRECNADTVFALSSKTFARQGLANPFSREYLARLVDAAQANNSGACLAATDQHGQVHAACLLVWDPKKTYYLVAGGDPDLRSSGAQPLLTWEAIQFASKRSAAFDFEGSILETIEGVFRQFGGKQVPYNCIMKFPLWLHTYLLASKRI
jgi:Acetyltransferase (GNAT) domain